MRLFSKFLAIALVAVGLGACAEKNFEYYRSNLDAAESKILECKKEMSAAFEKMDAEKIDELSKDTECEAAVEARSAHEKEVAEFKAAEKQKAFEKDYERFKAELGSLSFEEFYSADSCAPSFGFLEMNPRCSAYEDLKGMRFDQAMDELIAEYPGDQLSVYHETQCKGEGYNKAYCEISKLAIAKQEKKDVAFYLDNVEQLKTDHNVCYEKIKSLNSQNLYSDAQTLAATYRCRTAEVAARQFGVYYYSQPLEL